jgi:hypothetical protein
LTSTPHLFEPDPEDCVEAYAYLNVADPLIAWLVYRGEMVAADQVDPSAVSIWATRYLEGAATHGPSVRHAAEEAIERVRVAEYPRAVSRLRGFYVFPDRTSALEASRRWSGQFRPEFLVELGIRPDSRDSRHDAEWITTRFGNDFSEDWMRAYLAGDPADASPIWELLVDGRAWIYGTELRQAAYEVVKATWPASLALLELARIAAWVDSDLGLISALAVREGDEIVIKYGMKFDDANNPEFLKRAFAPNVERNVADLNSESELIRPDLRSRELRFPAV